MGHTDSRPRGGNRGTAIDLVAVEGLQSISTHPDSQPSAARWLATRYALPPTFAAIIAEATGLGIAA